MKTLRFSVCWVWFHFAFMLRRLIFLIESARKTIRSDRFENKIHSSALKSFLLIAALGAYKNNARCRRLNIRQQIKPAATATTTKEKRDGTARFSFLPRPQAAPESGVNIN